jgi:ABC-2 type transport system ATP-binding protein
MLTGLARPDSGRIQVSGRECTKDPKAGQDLIGVVPDESNLYAELTGFGNLCFCASLYGMGKQEREQQAEELLNMFGLADAGNRTFAGYSKGMKRKLTIAAGMIHHPRILFLDEPTTGLDVASARQIRQLIAELHRSGTTIFLTTHYIEEAERLCERIAFIVNGGIVRIDSVANLLQPMQGKHVMVLTVENAASDLYGTLAEAYPEYTVQSSCPGQIRIESAEPVSLGSLVRFIEECRADVIEARRMRPSLEDVFVRITGIEANMMKKEKEKRGGPQ